eukprot:4739472-Amphidinium_carterae.1
MPSKCSGCIMMQISSSFPCSLSRCITMQKYSPRHRLGIWAQGDQGQEYSGSRLPCFLGIWSQCNAISTGTKLSRCMSHLCTRLPQFVKAPCNDVQEERLQDLPSRAHEFKIPLLF